MIFETDMENDVDDTLALDMIHKYAEVWKVDLVGIMKNKNNKYSAKFIDIMGTCYNHANVLVGIVRSGLDSVSDAVNYAQVVCGLKENEKPVFERILNDYESFPESPLIPGNTVTATRQLGYHCFRRFFN